jgi:hypothetical protein
MRVVTGSELLLIGATALDNGDRMPRHRPAKAKPSMGTIELREVISGPVKQKTGTMMRNVRPRAPLN